MSAVKRHRRSTLRAERAEQTRARIADAARRRFARDGYAATTLQAIADDAEVAVQTVYAVYGSKAGILRALRDAVVDQPEAAAKYREAMEAPSAADAVARFASSIRARWEPSADVVAIQHDAESADPKVRQEGREVLARRRAGIAALARRLGPELKAGLSVARAGAILDALTLPEIYAELVGVQAWTPEEYERWLAGALERELLPTDP